LIFLSRITASPLLAHSCVHKIRQGPFHIFVVRVDWYWASLCRLTRQSTLSL
jgi:hypothetical protein